MCFLNHVRLFATPWAIAHQAPLSLGFSRQENWSGWPCPPPGDLPSPGTGPRSPTSPSLAGRFFTVEPPGKFLYLTGTKMNKIWSFPCRTQRLLTEADSHTDQHSVEDSRTALHEEFCRSRRWESQLIRRFKKGLLRKRMPELEIDGIIIGFPDKKF